MTSSAPVPQRSGPAPTVDVSGLAQERLDTGTFPAERRSEFRVHIAPAVHAGVHDHAAKDTSVEICGVLVGRWAQDADGPYANITEMIRCEQAAQKFAEVTFTHESWSQINKEMDSKYQDLRIIGWYHSHPNFGIFLSDRDVFIQEHFFSGPGQVAFVVDPVRKIEGMFEWRRGKPTPMSHYWIGNHLAMKTADEPPAQQAAAGVAAAGTAPPPVESWSAVTMPLLFSICTFLLGYMLSGRLTSWERQNIEAGAVARYGLWKGVRPGLEEYLGKLEGLQSKLLQEVKELSAEHAELVAEDKEKKAELAKRWRTVQEELLVTRRGLHELAEVYGYTDSERATLLQIVMQQQRELENLSPPSGKDDGRKKEKPKESDSKSNKSSDEKPPAKEPEKSKSESKSEPVTKDEKKVEK